MFSPTMELTLTAEERADLHAVVRAITSPAGLARRARCILLLADGESYSTVCATLRVRDRYISQWKRRYLAGGLLALTDAHAPAGRTIACPPPRSPRCST
jgi:hypothetical protein